MTGAVTDRATAELTELACHAYEFAAAVAAEHHQPAGLCFGDQLGG